MPHLPIDDTELYYEVAGEGTPLVMIRGVGSTLGQWFAQVPDFARGHRVVTFDNRGVGRSSRGSAAITAPRLAADVRALLAGLSALPAHVLGVSLGGMIAQELALSYPEAVRSLVLVATHCGGQDNEPTTPEAMAAFTRVVTGTATDPQADLLSAMFAPGAAQRLPLVVARYFHVSSLETAPPQVMQEQYQAVRGFDACGRLPGLACPTLVLCGRQDGMIPPGNSRRLAGLIPGARLEMVDQAGHQVLLEQAAPCNELVLEFLSQVDGGSAGVV
ncbi:MAG: alpha/beta hydrolase [Deltaproteobacteria bacterium]|nr:alpha/beta hydrolase [Deltaproteobacteria bacterium]